MANPTDSTGLRPISQAPHEVDPEFAEAVREHLKRVLASEPFRATKRCQAFLEYVVARKLEGREAQLKERTIGVEIFGRPPDYETSADPIVRVKATEIRKRLAQFYQDSDRSDPIAITLPPGSYVPFFSRTDATAGLELEDKPAPSGAAKVRVATTRSKRSILYYGLSSGVLIAIAAVFLFRSAFPSELEQFWAPVFDSPRPVLVCLGSAKKYILSENAQSVLEDARTHPERRTQIWLKPEDVEHVEGEISKYNMHAALALERLFATRGKASQFRVGNEVLLDEMRDQPAVTIGAFSNPWTLQITRDLRFTFEFDTASRSMRVRDQAAPDSRKWLLKSETPPRSLQDYAIITRVFDPTTRRVFLSPAGLNGFGTEAAAEFLTHPEYWKGFSRIAPQGWQRMNLQIVLETKIIGNNASPPKVLATHFW